MNKVLLFVLKGILLLPVLFLLVLNGKVYYSPPCEGAEKSYWNAASIAQLRHLAVELERGAAEEMQAIYPEGAVFTYALYALAWADVLDYTNTTFAHREEGVNALNKAIEFLLSEEARQPFSPDLPLAYGAFYQGWSTYVLGRKLQLQAGSNYDSTTMNSFQEKCNMIAATFAATDRPYLSSYSAGTWPADNLLCLAALVLHDQLFTPAFSSTIQIWLQRVKTHLDPHTGLIPHEYNPNHPGSARGSSQSLMLNFLPLIDTAFAHTQFALYQEHFLTYRFGLPGIREYPKGTSGTGDIDAGPILLGIGGAASVVGSRALLMNGDCPKHMAIRNSIEGFGVPTKWSGKKKYLGGKLAVADAFIAWANAPSCRCSGTRIAISWLFHLYSLLLIFSLSWLAHKI
ncbi:MAG: hypothetical protein KTR30_12800 [Saprospiraceae bacterium]|nr:hypothetical protein [Saprospiraceae bacterium]